MIGLVKSEWPAKLERGMVFVQGEDARVYAATISIETWGGLGGEYVRTGYEEAWRRHASPDLVYVGRLSGDVLETLNLGLRSKL